MSDYKSKAEERRAEWLSRQYAADFASTPAVLLASEAREADQRARKLAAAERAVVKAAMDAYQYDGGDPIRQRELDLERNAACRHMRGEE
jgi:hypothetical protein